MGRFIREYSEEVGGLTGQDGGDPERTQFVAERAQKPARPTVGLERAGKRVDTVDRQSAYGVCAYARQEISSDTIRQRLQSGAPLGREDAGLHQAIEAQPLGQAAMTQGIGRFPQR